jgi:hypothetical protein
MLFKVSFIAMYPLYTASATYKLVGKLSSTRKSGF